jgi:hypothetical protein
VRSTNYKVLSCVNIQLSSHSQDAFHFYSRVVQLEDQEEWSSARVDFQKQLPAEVSKSTNSTKGKTKFHIHLRAVNIIQYPECASNAYTLAQSPSQPIMSRAAWNISPRAANVTYRKDILKLKNENSNLKSLVFKIPKNNVNMRFKELWDMVGPTTHPNIIRTMANTRNTISDWLTLHCIFNFLENLLHNEL